MTLQRNLGGRPIEADFPRLNSWLTKLPTDDAGNVRLLPFDPAGVAVAGRALGPGIVLRAIPDVDGAGDPVLDAAGEPVVRYGLFARSASGAEEIALLSGTAGQPNQPALLLLAPAPGATSAPGTPGEIRVDGDYIWVCVAPDTWKRTGISGGGGAAHDAVSLDASASPLLSISAGQVISADAQAANTALAGPVSGSAAAPTFRAFTAANDVTDALQTSGARDGGSAAAQKFANGIVGPSWKPAADSTTALQLQKADGTSVVNVDTTNGRVGFGGVTDPVGLIDVMVDGNGAAFRRYGGPPPVSFYRANGTHAAKTATTAGATLGVFAGYGYEGSQYLLAASWYYEVGTVISAGVISGKLRARLANTAGALFFPFAILETGCVGISAETFGTNAAKVLGIGNGTAPTTSPADITQIWSGDQGNEAGNAGPHVRSETGKTLKFGNRLANSGGRQMQIAAKTTTYTATVADRVLTCDATGAAFTVTLPTAAAAYDSAITAGSVLTFIKIDSSANAVTIGGTIDGVVNPTLAAQWDKKTIISNGTTWYSI